MIQHRQHKIFAVGRLGCCPKRFLCRSASQASSGGQPHQVLEYRYVDGILEKRGPYRSSHLAAVRSLVISLKPAKMASKAPSSTWKKMPLYDNILKSFQMAHADKGKVVLAGAYGDPIEGAYIIFKNSTVEEVQSFAGNDPYVTSGLVLSYGIKPYHVVVIG